MGGELIDESYAGGPAASTGPGSVGIIGGGRAGRALAREIRAAGLSLVGLWNRTRSDPPADLAEVWASGGALPAAIVSADVVLLAVLDDAIAAVAEGLRPRPGAVVLHLSGALGAEALDPLPAGVHRGCYHPLQSFGATTSADLPVPPYCVAVEGDPAAVRAATALADATGHPAVTIPPGGKAAYHAAAVLASNCLVALEAIAARAMRSAGVGSADAWRLLWPLVVGTLANLRDGEFPAALTGPVPRGDAGTVSRNLQALGHDADAGSVYRALARVAVQVASEGGLSEERAAAVLAALRED